MDVPPSSTSFTYEMREMDADRISNNTTTLNTNNGSDAIQSSSVTNVNGKISDYCGFQIKEEKFKLFHDLNKKIDLKYIPCYICWIEVPNQFLKDHFTSKKHKMYKRLIDTSLERLKHIVDDVQVFEESYLRGSHYCSTCNIIVNMKEKELHEKQNMHKTLLTVDQVLINCMTLYTNDSEMLKRNVYTVVNADNIHDLTNNTSKPIDTDTNKLNKPILNNDAFTQTIDVTKKEMTEPINHIRINNDNLTDETENPLFNFKTKKSLQDYIKLIKLNCNINFNVVGNDNLEIITACGSLVKIFEMNFHGLKNVSDVNYECILCSKLIDIKDKWSHVYEEDHIAKVSVQLQNKNCIRQIDDRRSHCLLCNMLTKSYESHITLDNHKLAIHNALIATYASANMSIGDKALQNPKIKITNTIEQLTMQDDLTKRNKEYNYVEAVLSNNIQQSEIPNNVTKYHKEDSHMEAVLSNNIQQSAIQNNVTKDDNHVVDSVLANNIRLSAVQNNATKYDKEDNHVVESVLVNNIQRSAVQNNVTKYHKEDNHVEAVLSNKIQQSVLPNNVTKYDKEDNHVVESVLPNNIQRSVVQNNVTKYDKKDNYEVESVLANNILQSVLPNNVTKYDKEDNHVVESVLANNIQRSAVQNNVTEYNKEDYHVEAVLSNKIQQSVLPNNVTKYDKEDNHVVESVLANNIQRSTVQNNATKYDKKDNYEVESVLANNILQSAVQNYATKCDKEDNHVEAVVANNIQELSIQHAVTEYDKEDSNVESVLSNKIKKNNLQILIVTKYDSAVIRTQSFVCSPCGVNIKKRNYKNVYAHLISKRHSTAILTKKSTELLRVHYHFDITSLPHLNCLVCKIVVEKNKHSMIAHINSKSHQLKYNEILKKNQIKKIKKKYFCNICFKYVDDFLEIIHCMQKCGHEI